MDENITLNELSARVNKINMDRDMLVFSALEPFLDMDFPIRFDGMLIALVTEGTGHVGIDLREYDLQPNSLLVIHPRNYIYFAEGHNIKLDVVACSLSVVENVLPKLTDLMPLLMHHRAEPVSLLSAEDAAELRRYYQFLNTEMQGPDTPFLKKKMLALLQAALFEMMDIQCRREQTSGHRKTRKEEIMAKFILLVSENFRTQRQVGFYAGRLCVSSKHLSAVVKEISGRTAGDWIENYVTVEAKVLLRSTDLTIQEIASRLNFTNQSFFGKYFKHQTGMSPTEYRRREG